MATKSRMTKEDKALEKKFDDSYRRLGNGVQVDMMDLGKLHREAVAAAKAGATMDDAVASALAKYRKN